MKRLQQFGFGIATISFLFALVMYVMGMGGQTGIPVIIGFVGLIVGMMLSEPLKGYVFSVLIFMSVALAMYYPSLFQTIGEFELKGLIIPILMVIMFGMGTSMSVEDFLGVLRMPKGVLVGIICQFTIMPFVGLGLASLSGFPPEIAAGIILIGCSPSGLASNVMSYISKSNLALSLTLTMIATLLAPFITPFLMQLLADQLVPIDFLSMMQSILKIVIGPVVLGLILNTILKGERFERVKKILPLVSMAGIVLIIAIITAAGRDSMLTIGWILMLVVVVHNVSGYFLGYLLGKGVGLDEASARTVAFEVGMQNGGLASGIALEMGKLATMGLAPALFGPFMNISGSILATVWKERPMEIKDETLE
ncbi:MAG: bile acid:sodium symporter family protein [Bacteroidota bacterium]